MEGEHEFEFVGSDILDVMAEALRRIADIARTVFLGARAAAEARAALERN